MSNDYTLDQGGIQPLRIQVRCLKCLDSFIAIGLYGPIVCNDCCPKAEMTPAARKISDCVLGRLAQSKPIDAALLDAARCLANATQAEPIRGDVLESALSCDRRRVSELMKRLRDEWQLPAIGSRSKPTGYFVAVTGEQLLEWNRVTRSQAISELATSYQLVKAQYPELIGQQSLDFINTVSTELKEAIR